MLLLPVPSPHVPPQPSLWALLHSLHTKYPTSQGQPGTPASEVGTPRPGEGKVHAQGHDTSQGQNHELGKLPTPVIAASILHSPDQARKGQLPRHKKKFTWLRTRFDTHTQDASDPTVPQPSQRHSNMPPSSPPIPHLGQPGCRPGPPNPCLPANQGTTRSSSMMHWDKTPS